jgi:DNA-binding LacI/PurR family transcriptional regulator
VPDDVALVGVDDVEECRFSAPTLTSIAIDRTVMADLAFGLLLERLDGYEGEPRLLTAAHRLVVRESTGS